MIKSYLLLAFAFVIEECTSETCRDIHLGKSSYGKTSNDGLYHFKPNNSDPYLIYCDFETGHGYTYISTTAYRQHTFPENHNYNNKELKVILLYKNGSQYETTISRPKKSRKFDVLYTYKSSEKRWLTNDLMYPYITVSMKSKMKNMTSRGYLANGAKVPDRICNVTSKEKNKKQYAHFILGFLFNHNNTDPLKDEKKRKSTDFLKRWVNLATLVPEEEKLSRNFFSFFELKHRNCGGYMTNEDFPDIVGAALGLKYAIECRTPPDVANASKQISGHEYNSVVTYTCDDGYEFVENNTKLTCSDMGEWQGDVSTCIVRKPRNCIDHMTMNSARISGVYIVFDRQNQPYDVYCDLYDNYTITFLTSDSMNPSNFKYHYNDNTVAVVRSYIAGGRQVDSEIRQLTKGHPIDMNYGNEVRRRRWTKLLYITVNNGVWHDRHTSNTMGYRVNDVEVRTTEERYRYNRYNKFENKKAIKFETSFEEPTIMNAKDNLHWFLEKWYYEAESIPGERYMPKKFFFSFEMASDVARETENGFADVYGINIGLRYNKN